jgi:hypothetical protein
VLGIVHQPRRAPLWRRLTTVTVVVAMAPTHVQAAPASVDPWPSPEASATRAIDPAMPTSIPSYVPAPTPPPLVQPTADPRNEYIAERLRHQRARQGSGPSGAPEHEPGKRLIIGGVAALSVGALSLLIGGAIRANYNAEKPESEHDPTPPPADDPECEMFCGGFPEFNALDWRPKGTLFLTAGAMEVLAGVTMLTIGLLLRRQAAQPRVQRTAQGTWTVGLSLRF